MAYTIKLATLGTSEITLTGAVPVTPVEKEVNQPGTFSWAIDTRDPQAATADSWPLEREVHVYRDATRIFAGPIVNADFDGGLLRFECDGLLKYMAQRNIDSGADRENFIPNPQFEDDLTGWTTVATTSAAVTGERVLGTKSAELSASASLLDAYIKTADIAVTGTGVGSLYTLVGWFKIDPDDWIGEAIGGRGLTLSRSIAGVIQQSGDYQITGDTPRGSWQRAETTVWVPPNSVETLQVRAYSPGGTIWWDALSLTLMESLSSVEGPDDFLMEQTTIAERIVAHVQDPANGKDALSITYDTPASGVQRERHYQHAEHTNALQALLEFTELDEGFDIEITPARVFKTHYPFKGTDRTATVTLKTPRAGDETNVNCLLRRWRFDGDQAASAVVVLGAGDGPDREEGGATDTTVFGGRTVEAVITPRATTAIDTLDEMATRELVDRTNPAYFELLVTDTALVSTLVDGDIVDLDVDFGCIQGSGDWRIMNTSEDLETGLLTVTVRAMP